MRPWPSHVAMARRSAAVFDKPYVIIDPLQGRPRFARVSAAKHLLSSSARVVDAVVAQCLVLAVKARAVLFGLRVVVPSPLARCGPEERRTGCSFRTPRIKTSRPKVRPQRVSDAATPPIVGWSNPLLA
jgi:hypothetical protein